LNNLCHFSLRDPFSIRNLQAGVYGVLDELTGSQGFVEKSQDLRGFDARLYFGYGHLPTLEHIHDKWISLPAWVKNMWIICAMLRQHAPQQA